MCFKRSVSRVFGRSCVSKSCTPWTPLKMLDSCWKPSCFFCKSDTSNGLSVTTLLHGEEIWWNLQAKLHEDQKLFHPIPVGILRILYINVQYIFILMKIFIYTYVYNFYIYIQTVYIYMHSLQVPSIYGSFTFTYFGSSQWNPAFHGSRTGWATLKLWKGWSLLNCNSHMPHWCHPSGYGMG